MKWCEPLTDSEKRIFLAAMGREKKICERIDEECRDISGQYDIRLVKVCDEIIRKIKGALW